MWVRTSVRLGGRTIKLTRAEIVNHFDFQAKAPYDPFRIPLGSHKLVVVTTFNLDSAMPSNSSKLEQRYLMITTLGSLIISCFGIVVSFFASSEAILLDGLFNGVYFLASLLTIRVSILVRRGDSERFHFGYAFFEPLINGAKGALLLGVTLMAFVGAVQSLFAGGSMVSAGPGILYGAIASSFCWLMAWITLRGVKFTESPLVKVDSENWLVNATITSGVLVAFLCVYLVQGTSLKFISPYVDPTLVIAIVMITVSVPVKMAWTAVMEFLNRAPAPDVVLKVKDTLETVLRPLPLQAIQLRITQPGRTRMVLAHVVLPTDFTVERLSDLDAYHRSCQSALQQEYPMTTLDVIFTADRDIGAALGR